MGANAVTKLRRVVMNVQRVLGIELLTAAQAIDFRKEHSAPALNDLHTALRLKVSFMKEDRVLHDDLIAAEQFLNADANTYLHG